MRIIRPIFFAILYAGMSLLGLSFSPLYSHTLEPVKVQLLSTHGQAAPVVHFILKIDLAKGWKTYGPLSAQQTTSSFPLQLRWNNSLNVKSLDAKWPPLKDLQGPEGQAFQGYTGHIQVPLEVQVAQPREPVTLSLQLEGLACQTLCVPYLKECRLTLPAPSHPRENGGETKGGSVWEFLKMMLFALLGGIILNLMPCVLPVLSLKLVGLVREHATPHQRRRHFLWSFAGIMTTFLGMATVATSLQSAGSALGWGMHFQNPWFLGLMVGVLTLFALNLWGIFEIRLPAWIGGLETALSGKHHGYIADFLGGVMATLLATPCSAPFLGTAVAYALGQGPGVIFLMFSMLGMGFGLPYLALGMLPASWVHLPRPGRWMQRLRKILGVGLFLTAGWLAIPLLRPVWAPLATLMHASSTPADSLKWHPFEPGKIPALVAAGHVVVVDVTADWCMTCQYNKKMVVNTPAVHQLLQHPKVFLMRGDWTYPNEQIRQFLQEHGRYGIPFNMVFGPQDKNGIVLSEILTQDTVRDALQQAGLFEHAP